MKRVLILGAGLVSRPLVRYVLEQAELRVAVASRTKAKAEALVEGATNGWAIGLDAEDRKVMSTLIADSDLVVSLLPYRYHPQIAGICLQLGKHLVTTSYVSPAMAEYDAPAKEAGLIFLNEVGLDPGIDHMAAMRMIVSAQEAGGIIRHFSSYCGGLPAPEESNNPFGYKFSWSPRGVLLAGRNDARFLRDGEEIKIAGADLFDNYWTVSINDLGVFEGYPNRDSLPYIPLYGLTEARGIFRGTLRNLGWCATMKRISELGLLDDVPWGHPAPVTWAGLMRQLCGAPNRLSPRESAAECLDLDPDAPELDHLEWLGLFSQSLLPEGSNSPLDALVSQMQGKMAYGPNERDMIILKHELLVEYPDHSEGHSTTLVQYGTPGGDSAMALTVGLPAAMACRHILDGTIQHHGVCIPTLPEIYEPILNELEAQGICFAEERTQFD